MRTFSIKINYESFFCSHEGNRFILHIIHYTCHAVKRGYHSIELSSFYVLLSFIGCGIGLENPFSNFFIYIFFSVAFLLLPSIQLNAGGITHTTRIMHWFPTGKVLSQIFHHFHHRNIGKPRCFYALFACVLFVGWWCVACLALWRLPNPITVMCTCVFTLRRFPTCW